MYAQSLEWYVGAADGWTVPRAEGAEGERRTSCLRGHPPWPVTYPAEGRPRVTPSPQLQGT